MIATTSNTYIRFFSASGDPIKDEYVSIEEYMQSDPDSFQADRDTHLYEYVNGAYHRIYTD